MDKQERNRENVDVIDDDLFEDIDEEEMAELLEEERQKLSRRQERKEQRRFPKWAFWLIVFAMVLQVIALIPRTFSIPAIDFLITSAKLSTQADIQAYKKAVVVIEQEGSRGTGFSISEDGYILTNAHVVEGSDSVTVAFKDEGLFNGIIVATYPEIDLAVVKVNDSNDFPYLELADDMNLSHQEDVIVIGNPLSFRGIANEGQFIGPLQLSNWDVPVQMISAPIYRGNSGSPVLNEHGEVVGVVFATYHHSDYGKVGLFVPIDYFHIIYEEIFHFKDAK